MIDLTYKDVVMPEDCIFKISPSSINKFFEYPSVWYAENVLNETTFKGNTSTMLGTICHYIYECVAKNNKVTREDINEYLDSLDNPDINIEEIKSIYPAIADVVVNNYILQNKPQHIEIPLVAHVKNNVYVGGTCDNITGSVVCDYKNVASKPNEDTIPWNYKIQLMAYAYAARSKGMSIDRIRLIYGVRPLKTTPARCYVVTKQIDYEDWQDIENTLELIADTITTIKSNPELSYLLFKSMKLKV